MAVVLPLLAAAGAAAGAAGTAGTVIAGVSALATIAGGIGQYQQGKAQDEQADLNARRIELEGRMDAITTNEELLKTLSMNTVAAAAGGLTSSGSVQRAQEESQANAAKQLSISRMNTESTAAATRETGRQAKSAGTAGLLGSFMQAGTSVYGSAKTIKRT